MAVILDTQTFFWWITGADRLPSRHRQIIETKEEILYVSAVTGWEIALKVKIGKWPAATALVSDLESAIKAEGFDVLDLSLAQAKLAGSLDLVHRDPFDRLLAAQSMTLGIPIASIDPALKLLGAAVV